MIAYSLLALRFKACVGLLNLQSINKCYKGYQSYSPAWSNKSGIWQMILKSIILNSN